MSASADPRTPGAEGDVPQTVSGKLIAFLRRPDVSGMVAVVLVKAVMVGLNFALIMLAARALGTVQFGYYSILFSAATLLTIVATAGQELFILRAWSEFITAGDSGRLRGALRFTFSMCALACLVVGTGFIVWSQSVFGGETAAAATAFLILASLLLVTSHLVRGAVGVVLGDGAGHALLVFPAVAYLAAMLATGGEATLTAIFVMLALGAAIGLLLHGGLVVRALTQHLPAVFSARAVADRAAWLKRSGRLWLATSIEALNQYADVLIVGYLMSPAVAGAYFVIARLANLFAAAADSINLYATRHFPSLYYGGARRELSGFLDSLAWIAIAFIAVGMVGIAAGGYVVLMLINEDYTRYFPELLVLCLGTAALAVTRPCGSVLMLSGHEGAYLKVLAGTVAVRIAVLFLLIPLFGLMGAVVASAVSYFAMAALLRMTTIAFAGIDPSFVRLWVRGAADVVARGDGR